MNSLQEWKAKIEAGLQKLQQDLAKLEVSIQRQEGALMMVNELIREQAAELPAGVVAESEPVA